MFTKIAPHANTNKNTDLLNFSRINTTFLIFKQKEHEKSNINFCIFRSSYRSSNNTNNFINNFSD